MTAGGRGVRLPGCTCRGGGVRATAAFDPLPTSSVQRSSQNDSERGARPLFNDLVGDSKHARRNFEAERLGGLEIDHQVEFRRLDHRKVSRLFALENAAGILAGLMIRAGKVGSIARKSPGSSGAWRTGMSRPRRPPAKLRRAIAFS